MKMDVRVNYCYWFQIKLSGIHTRKILNILLFAFFTFCGYHIQFQLNNKWQLIRKTDSNKSMITSTSTTSTKDFILFPFLNKLFRLVLSRVKTVLTTNHGQSFIFSTLWFYRFHRSYKIILYNKVLIQRHNRNPIWKPQDDKFSPKLQF